MNNKTFIFHYLYNLYNIWLGNIAPQQDINNTFILSDDLRNKSLNEENQRLPTIFTKRNCRTCKIIRPPLASHCSKCNNCVLNFDQYDKK